MTLDSVPHSARSVLNHEEITFRLVGMATGRPDHIKHYVKTVVRKFYLKNWTKFSKIEKAVKEPKFLGFKTPDNENYDTFTIIVQTENGPIVKQAPVGSELHTLLSRGEVILLDTAALSEIRNELMGVLDWMTSVYRTKRDLTAISYKDAQRKAQEWHDDQVRVVQNMENKEREKLAVESIAGTVPVFEIGILDSSSGTQVKEIWYLYHLISKSALEYEGNKLHHCVGNGHYFNQIVENIFSIWSLRSSLLEPTLTITVAISEFNHDLIIAEGLLRKGITQKQALIIKQVFDELNINLSLFPLVHTESKDIEIEYYKQVGEIPSTYNKGNKDAERHSNPPEHN